MLGNVNALTRNSQLPDACMSNVDLTSPPFDLNCNAMMWVWRFVEDAYTVCY